jgi:glycosyltransferase involved in cell wall biosynthesis
MKSDLALFFVDQSFLSGAEAQILRNYVAIANSGVHTCLVSSLPDTEDIIRSLFFDAVPKESFIIKYPTRSNATLNPIRNLLIDQFMFFVAAVRGFRLGIKLRPFLAHINNGGFPGSSSSRGFTIGLAIASPDTRIVSTVNNIAVGYTRPSRWIDFAFDFVLSKLSINWVTASKEAQQSLQKVLRLSPRAVHVIPNGVQIPTCKCTASEVSEQLDWLDGKRVVLSIGHLEKRKGHEYLIRCVHRLRSNSLIRDETVFLIEGTGSLSKELGELVASLELTDLVVFLGHQACISHWQQRCDLYVHPSISHEDLPNVISEVLSLGKPVVATKIAGIPTQVGHGLNGFLCEPRNSEELALSIARLLEDDNLRLNFGINSKTKWINQFTPERAVRQYLNLYEMREIA